MPPSWKLPRSPSTAKSTTADSTTEIPAIAVASRRAPAAWCRPKPSSIASAASSGRNRSRGSRRDKIFGGLGSVRRVAEAVQRAGEGDAAGAGSVSRGNGHAADRLEVDGREQQDQREHGDAADHQQAVVLEPAALGGPQRAAGPGGSSADAGEDAADEQALGAAEQLGQQAGRGDDRAVVQGVDQPGPPQERDRARGRGGDAVAEARLEEVEHRGEGDAENGHDGGDRLHRLVGVDAEELLVVQAVGARATWAPAAATAWPACPAWSSTTSTIDRSAARPSR